MESIGVKLPDREACHLSASNVNICNVCGVLRPRHINAHIVACFVIVVNLLLFCTLLLRESLDCFSVCYEVPYEYDRISLMGVS
jgi:hypothetical protein